MFEAFVRGIGPPQVGWWLTMILVAIAVVALIAIVIISVFAQIGSRNEGEERPSLPRSSPKAA